jgi:hypothetical protein
MTIISITTGFIVFQKRNTNGKSSSTWKPQTKDTAIDGKYCEALESLLPARQKVHPANCSLTRLRTCGQENPDLAAKKTNSLASIACCFTLTEDHPSGVNCALKIAR